MRRQWLWRAGFVVASLANLTALYGPESGPDVRFPLADKLVHVLLFAAVAFTGDRLGLPVRWLVGVLVAHAVVSELVQHYWLPQRSGDLLDTLADLVGTVLGVWLAGGRPAPAT